MTSQFQNIWNIFLWCRKCKGRNWIFAMENCLHCRSKQQTTRKIEKMKKKWVSNAGVSSVDIEYLFYVSGTIGLCDLILNWNLQFLLNAKIINHSTNWYRRLKSEESNTTELWTTNSPCARIEYFEMVLAWCFCRLFACRRYVDVYGEWKQFLTTT